MYSWNDYPPKVPVEELTINPVQWNEQDQTVAWKDRKGLRVGRINATFTPPPKSAPPVG